MDKGNNLISAKAAVISNEEAAITIASDIISKENVEKTIKAMKDIAKNVKAKASRAATAARKTLAKKVETSFYIQYKGKEILQQTILEKVYEEWLKSDKLSEIKTIDIYLKVEEDTAYCIVNSEIKIDIKLF